MGLRRERRWHKIVLSRSARRFVVTLVDRVGEASQLIAEQAHLDALMSASAPSGSARREQSVGPSDQLSQQLDLDGFWCSWCRGSHPR